MKPILLVLGLVAGLIVPAGPVSADTIRKACLTAPRAGDARLCACIQAAADRTLTRKDQKLAATFFKDPDRAQEIRQSDRSAHEAFWQRYKAFGQTAEAFCS